MCRFMEKLTFMRLILIFQVNPSDYFSSCIRLQIICFLLIKIYKQEIKIFCYEHSCLNNIFKINLKFKILTPSLNN